jgi:hypothetical protein
LDISFTKFHITQVNILNLYEPQILTQVYIDQNMLQCKFRDFFDHI